MITEISIFTDNHNNFTLFLQIMMAVPIIDGIQSEYQSHEYL